MRPLSAAMAISVAGLVAGLSLPLAAQPGAGAAFGARDPVGCPRVVQRQAPSAEQAALLIRCKRETLTGGELWLMESVRVEVGGAQPFASLYNVIAMPGADTSKPVHPVRGSWTWAVCTSLGCRETDVGDATGACWQTTAGDWQCAMNGRSGTTRQGTRAPR